MNELILHDLEKAVLDKFIVLSIDFKKILNLFTSIEIEQRLLRNYYHALFQLEKNEREIIVESALDLWKERVEIGLFTIVIGPTKPNYLNNHIDRHHYHKKHLRQAIFGPKLPLKYDHSDEDFYIKSIGSSYSIYMLEKQQLVKKYISTDVVPLFKEPSPPAKEKIIQIYEHFLNEYKLTVPGAFQKLISYLKDTYPNDKEILKKYNIDPYDHRKWSNSLSKRKQRKIKKDS